VCAIFFFFFLFEHIPEFKVNRTVGKKSRDGAKKD
jgi:hypothetical protein